MPLKKMSFVCLFLGMAAVASAQTAAAPPDQPPAAALAAASTHPIALHGVDFGGLPARDAAAQAGAHASSSASDKPWFSLYGDGGFYHQGDSGFAVGGGLQVEFPLDHAKPHPPRLELFANYDLVHTNGDNECDWDFDFGYEDDICDDFDWMVGAGVSQLSNGTETARALEFLFGIEEKVPQHENLRPFIQLRVATFDQRATMLTGGVRLIFR